VQGLTLESGTDRFTGQYKPQQDSAGRAGPDETSRIGQDEQDRTGREGQDRTSRTGQDEQDRTGRAQVGRIDDLYLDVVASFELETNQSGSGFIWTKDSKNIEMKVDKACVYSKRCGESVQITWSIVR
jgi:hypothetical protein